MPKKAAEGEVNKSQLIRELKKSDASLKPADISSVLKEKHGLDIPTNYISSILSQSKNRKVGAKRGRPPKSNSSIPKSAGRGRPRSTPAEAISLPSLLLAKKFIRDMGSLANAKSAIDAIGKLMD